MVGPSLSQDCTAPSLQRDIVGDLPMMGVIMAS